MQPMSALEKARSDENLAAVDPAWLRNLLRDLLRIEEKWLGCADSWAGSNDMPAWADQLWDNLLKMVGVRPPRLAGFGVEEGAARRVEEERSRHEPALVFEGRGFRAIAVCVVPEALGKSVGDLFRGYTAGLREPEPGVGQLLDIVICVPDVVTDDQVAVGRFFILDVLRELPRHQP